MIPALLFAFQLSSQFQTPEPQDDGPIIIRFGGRNSGFMDVSDLEQEFKKMPKHPPEPQYLVNFTLGFTNDPHFWPVFDDTYRPWRGLLAKRQIIDTLMESGPKRAYVISKLFFAPYSEISDQLDVLVPTYVFNQETCISFTLRVDIQIHLPRAIVPLKLPPSATTDPKEIEAAKVCTKYPLFRNDAHEQEVLNLNAKYAKLPTVKIWGATEPSPTNFENLQKQALKIYDTWSRNERVNIDQRLYDYLQRSNIWTDKVALYRCKVLGDIAAISPDLYKSTVDDLSRNYEQYGFPNETLFREAAKSAPLTSTTGFIANVSLGGERSLQFSLL